MKVALKEDVEKLGKKGDIKEVADGYARNFLIPRGLVEMATEAVIKRTEKIRQARKVTDVKEQKELSKLADQVAGQKIKLKAKAKDDKLFGSIAAADIAQAIADKTKVEIDKKMVVLPEPIKKVGEYVVKIKFVDDVEAEVVVKVVAE
ncbi:MAG: 50S ribosomal protein L9 [Parcubacteria group bacterium]|nr:50S ribosomal protein L9 [Parcubacteria group bacterium]